MKADFDDAPEWLLSKKQRGPGRSIAIGMFGLAVTVGGMLIAGEIFKSRANTIIERRVEAKRKAPIAEITRPEQPEKDWDAIVERVAKESETKATQVDTTAPEKQTVFTDANYVPKGATNIVSYEPLKGSYEPIKTQAAHKQPTQTKPQVVVVGKPDPKLSDYCPGGEGSLMRRNCKQRINLNTRNR